MVTLQSKMDAEAESPLDVGTERPDRIKVADTEDIADADTDFGVKCMVCGIRQIAIGYFGFDEFAEMQPSNTRNQIEKDSHTIPFRLQRGVFVRKKLVAMQEREAVRIISIALVAVGLPEKCLWDVAKNSATLKRICKRTSHTEIGMLCEHNAQVGVETACGVDCFAVYIGPMAAFSAEI